MFKAIRQNKSARRFGLLFAVIAWAVLMITPCFVIALAVQREIIVTWSDLPEDNFRVWSIQERELRGIGFSNARRVEPQPGTVCTITDTRFILWQGKAGNAHQCSCYQRVDSMTAKASPSWLSISEGVAACTLAEGSR